MDKRGNVPLILIFVIAVTLYLVALFSFASFDSKLEGEFEGNDKLVYQLELNYNFVVNEAEIVGMKTIKSGGNLREEFIKTAKQKEIQNEGFGNFFGKIRNGEFIFEKKDNKYFLKIDGLFVKSELGNSFVRRDFNLEIIFDDDGRVLVE